MPLGPAAAVAAVLLRCRPLRLRGYDVDATFTSLEQHGCGIHALCRAPAGLDRGLVGSAGRAELSWARVGRSCGCQAGPRPVSRDYDSALETICCASGPIKPMMWLIVSSGTPAALRAAIR